MRRQFRRRRRGQAPASTARLSRRSEPDRSPQGTALLHGRSLRVRGRLRLLVPRVMFGSAAALRQSAASSPGLNTASPSCRGPRRPDHESQEPRRSLAAFEKMLSWTKGPTQRRRQPGRGPPGSLCSIGTGRTPASSPVSTTPTLTARPYACGRRPPIRALGSSRSSEHLGTRSANGPKRASSHKPTGNARKSGIAHSTFPNGVHASAAETCRNQLRSFARPAS